MDLHTEGHAGAACGVVGRAAVVAPVGRAQGLQLEEPALLRELGVGVCLQSPRGGETLVSASPQAPGAEDQGTRGAGWWPLPRSGLAYRCPTDTPLGEIGSCGRDGASHPGLCPSRCCRGGSRSDQELELLEDLQSLVPILCVWGGKHREPQY